MTEAARAMPAIEPIVVGRYALFDELAAGGMATVHLGRLLGPVGFGRTVAVKRLHAHFLRDEEFITMFMDEARIVARIAHPNVVPMVDVVQSSEGLFLVMEYVHGESLSRLMRTARKANEPIPQRIVAAIICAVLLGLHAAHDTKGADGSLLGVVHRDVSPQNIIVGVDGAARVLDFGIAKAAGRVQVTREGQIKGKLAYMAPEQIRGQVDRRTDVFAAAVVLWEMLAGRRLHEGSKDVDIVTRVMRGTFEPPSHYASTISPELDAIVMRGLASDPEARFASARDLALELERNIGLASPSEVGLWVERLAKDVLEARGSRVSAMELAANDLVPATSVRPGTIDATSTREALDEQAHTDVPSSSAVFAQPAHTQVTQTGTGQLDAPTDRRGRAGAVAILLVALLLGLVGVGLAATALRQRAVRSASVDEHVVPPKSAPAIRAPAVEPRSTPVVEAAPSPAPTATGSPPKAARGPTVFAAPRPVGKVSLPATPKPSCDPPYVVDEVGHRHYKPECD